MLSDASKRTEQTLQNHLRAFGQGDVDAIMDEYTEDAVFITPDDTVPHFCCVLLRALVGDQSERVSVLSSDSL